MSWFGASDDVEEPVHHHHERIAQPSSAMLDLQCLLDNEREAHSLARQALETAKLDIKEWMSKAQQAAAETQSCTNKLETCEASLRLQYTQRENLEQTLSQNKSRLETLEKQMILHDRNSASEEAQQVSDLHTEITEERKKRKVADEGMQYWKSRAQSLENEKFALERQVANSTQSQASSANRGACGACEEKDTQLADQQDKVAILESQLSQLQAAKSTLESSNIQLTNQHTALERTSSREIAELQEQIENLTEEVNDLQMDTLESERQHAEELEDVQRRVKVEESARQICESELKGEKARFETLQAELVELENTNETLRIDIDAVSKASLSEIEDLKAQIQSMELHFHSSNSDLLSSRAALQHTQSKLSSLENLLNQFKIPSSPSSSASSSNQHLLQARSFDDEYVLSVKSELEDEIKLRTECEKRIEDLEQRVLDLVATTRDQQDEGEEVDLLQDRLKTSRSRLFDSQTTLQTLNEEQEDLRLEIGQLRSSLTDKEEAIGSLTKELKVATAENAAKEDRLADLIQELRDSQHELEEKNDELSIVSVELESLKRDALSLRNQIELSSLSQTPTPPYRKKHFRTNSAPFWPSPLRHASFPRLPASPSSSAHIQANLPYAHSLDVEDQDQQTLILVTRLRQERDEAVSQLTYYLVEHRIAAQCSDEDMNVLREEVKDAQARLAEVNAELERAEVALAASQEQNTQMRADAQESELVLNDLQDRYDQSLQALHALEAEEQDNKATQEDLRNTLADVMDERDALADSLQQAKIVLSGAQNAALTMQAELDQVRRTLQLQITSEASSSSETIAQLEDRIESLETQLEGAQNAALDLQSQIKDLVKGREMVEGVLRLQRDEIYSQLMKESAQSDILRSESILQKMEKELLEASLHETLQRNQDAIMETPSTLETVAQLEDRIEVLETQLDGAQNAALDLQDQIKDLVKGREMVEGVLRLQRDEIYSQLMKESAQSDILRSEGILQKLEKEQMEVSLEESRQQIQDFIVAMAQSGETHRKAVGDLQAQVDDKMAEALALREAMAVESAAVLPDNKTDDQQINTLILTLIQASSELRQLRATAAEQEARLANGISQSAQVYSQVDKVELEEHLKSLVEQLSTAQELATSQESRYAAIQEESSARAGENERLAADIERLEALRSELETALSKAQSVEASLLTRLDSADQTISSMTAQAEERTQERALLLQDIEQLKASLQDTREEAESLKENLRAAEEEGRNIVDDFNALSEEYEKTQREVTQLQQLDETKHTQTEQLQQQLADSTSRQEQAVQKYEKAIAQARELEVRLKQLEEDLENKQVEVEETDDRYLASLKTIKKQEVALDRLKVRIEALQRANGLLSKAVPATTPDVMAPAPPSAKKRGLPQEFVAPDPGPTAIVVSPPASAVQEAPRREQENVRSLSQNTVEDKSVEVKIALKADIITEKITSKHVAPTTATSTVRPRKPLAAVQAQAISQPSVAPKATEPAKLPSKLGSLSTNTSSRPAFKPTPSLSSRPLGSRTDPKDPKSLLAALQALKRPAPA